MESSTARVRSVLKIITAIPRDGDMKLTAAAKLILVYLHLYSKNGTIVVSSAELSKTLSISRRHVPTAIKALVAAGHIEVIRSITDGGANEANQYRILSPRKRA